MVNGRITWNWLGRATVACLLAMSAASCVKKNEEAQTESLRIVLQVDHGALREMLAAEFPDLDAQELDAKARKTIDASGEKTIDILNKRVDGIFQIGRWAQKDRVFKSDDQKDCFIVDCPPGDDEQNQLAKLVLEKPARLEFRLVHPDNDKLVSQLLDSQPTPEGFVKNEDEDGYIATPEYATLSKDPEYRKRLAKYGTETLDDHVMMLQKDQTRTVREKIYVPVFVSTHCEMTGGDLRSASREQSAHTGRMEVHIQFNKAGREAFALLTSKYSPHGAMNSSPQGRQLAIIVDGILYSAPTIQTPIRDGNAVISGLFTGAEASLLASLLNAGALPVPLKVIDARTAKPNDFFNQETQHALPNTNQNETE